VTEGGGSTSTGGSTSMESSTSSGTGGGSVCSAPSDCPTTGTECSSYTCVAGAGTLAFPPQGYPGGVPPMGDCPPNVCDGQGGTVMIEDDVDVPSDGNPCTQDLCSNGQPSHVPVAAGSACGPSGLECDGAGSCVHCLVDADCGVDTACAGYT